jgi:hypothetical protein
LLASTIDPLRTVYVTSSVEDSPLGQRVTWRTQRPPASYAFAMCQRGSSIVSIAPRES